MSYRRKAKAGQLFTIIFVSALLVLTRLSEAANYGDYYYLVNKNCEARDEVSKIFNKFDKIVLFIKETPPTQNEKPEEFPAKFTHSSIQRMAEEAVIKNFTGCDADIKENIVSVNRPAGDVFDSDNLVFHIRLRYPAESDGDIKKRYAVLEISPYRADLSDHQVLYMLNLKRAVVLFPFRNPQDFKRQFQEVFDALITPAIPAMPPK